MPTSGEVVGRYLRWFLAVLSAAAGLVHFAAAGEHFDVTAWHGSFFAVVGWLQLAWAVGVVVRPTDRRLLAAGAVLNGVVLVVWAVSRTVGVPIGPDAWTSEPVGFADALTSGFELLIIMLVVLVLVRPAVAGMAVDPGTARLGVIGASLAVVVVSTTAVTPAVASEHAHGADGHGDHGSYTIQADGTSNCEHSGVQNAGNAANGGHGHRGPVPWQPLDAEGRARLAEQLAAAQTVVDRYPTVADAEAAGFTRASVYVPCIAAHYLAPDRDSFDEFDPAEPQMLLFAGTDPDSELVGLSYSNISTDGPPDGFEGPNDVWHAHEQLCMKPGLVLGVETAEKDACEARGGVLVDTSNDWMMHMWNVPQWENRWGMFASEHPDLGGRMGDMDAPPDPEADGAWFEESEPAG